MIDAIMTRMMKNWNRISGNPDDPIVSMLLRVFATELEGISGDIIASRARVLERMVELHSPDVLTGALPAHAIARALPVEHTTNLDEESQFYTNYKLSLSNEKEEPLIKHTFFSPTGSFHLNRASVRFMATGNQLFKVNDYVGKEVIARSDNNSQLPVSTLWLGIDEPGVNLHNSLFYFDLPNQPDKQLFCHQLAKAQWFFNTMPLGCLPGYGNREVCGETIEVETLLNNDCNVGDKIKNHVNAFYKQYFISVNDIEGITSRKDNDNSSEIILNAFTGKEAQLLQHKPLRWIRICFPEAVSNAVLQDVICTMNCFPVVNRKLHNINYKLQELINIVPLNTEDTFLNLQEVSNDENIQLTAHATDNSGNGLTLMRNGGIGRFDERDAAALIDSLLHLLRDESAAFSSMDKNFIGTEIKQLQQVINKLEQKLFGGNIQKGSNPYLIINSDRKINGNLSIKYWSTQGHQANNVKAGTCLQLYKGAIIQNNTAVLVTSAKGGRDKLSATEKVLAYKSALLSKDRLITSEDIKAFCYYQLGDKVKNIVIQKGVMTLPGRQQGLKRTTDVIAELYEKAYENVKEKKELNSFWEENLQRLLEEKSAAFMQYRVIVKQAA